jgi:hypothetical protein
MLKVKCEKGTGAVVEKGPFRECDRVGRDRLDDGGWNKGGLSRARRWGYDGEGNGLCSTDMMRIVRRLEVASSMTLVIIRLLPSNVTQVVTRQVGRVDGGDDNEWVAEMET